MNSKDKTRAVIHMMVLMLWLAGSMVWASWTYTYDTATPPDSESPKLGDDRIREVKAALQERLAVDHVFGLTGTEVSDANAGKHSQVTFYDSSNSHSDPNLHIAEVDGVYELHFDDPCENTIQLTSGGALYIANSSIDSNMIIDVNSADITDGTILAADLDSDANDFCDDTTIEIDGTVGLRVKAGGVGLDQLASDAKFSPATYAGEESVTFPNGFILKQGYVAYSSATQTIAFGVAFPTAIKSVSITIKHNAIRTFSPYISSVSTSSFIIKAGESFTGYYWQAWGY